MKVQDAKTEETKKIIFRIENRITGEIFEVFENPNVEEIEELLRDLFRGFVESIKEKGENDA